MKKLFIFLFLGLFLISFASSALTDGLVSYYKLDETSGTTAYDLLGVNNGTNSGVTINQVGKIDKAYSFDGVNDWINTNSAFDTPAKTICAWFNATTINSNLKRVFDNDASAKTYGGINIYVNTTGIVYSQGTTTFVSSGISTNTWYYVCSMYNSTNYAFYRDGTLVSSGAYSSFNAGSEVNINLKIGAERGLDGTRFFAGKIDEVSIWNRTLTQAEITALYNSGAGSSYPFTGYSVNLIHPPFGSLLTDVGSLFNVTYNISGLSTNHVWKNATYNLYKDGSVFNQTTVALSGNNTASSLYIDDFTIGSYIWNVRACYGNVTFNNCTISSNYTYTVGASLSNLTYSSSVYETSNQMINATLNLVPGTNLYDVKIIYNGTQYQGDFADTGNNTFSVVGSFDTSKLNGASAENKSFYFRLIYSVGVNNYLYENTTSTNQTVLPISMSDCSTATNRTLNFTAKEEENMSTLNIWNFLGTFEYWLGSGTIRKNVSINNLNINSSSLCLNPAGNLTYKTDAIIQYEKAGYVKRNYYLYNASLTNTTQNVSLYLLASGSSTSFIVQIRDKSQLAVRNAYVYSQRYYPGTGNYETVAMGKTDNNGNTVLHFETETEDYRIIVMQDGVVRYTSPVQKVYCSATPCTLPIQIESGGVVGWENFGNLSNLIYTGPYYDNDTQDVIFTYIDTSGTTSYARLFVYEYVNNVKTTICNTTSTANAATLTCDVSGVEGTIFAEGYLSRSPEVLVWAKQFVINTIKAIMGMEGLFWALITIMVIAIAGALVGGVSGGVFGIVAGMWGVQLLQIASFGLITTWGVTVIGIIILWNMRN